MRIVGRLYAFFKERVIVLKKVFLIAFFAIFLMPLSAFASVPAFTHKGDDCPYYAVLRSKSSGKYYAICSKSKFVYVDDNGGNAYFEAPDFDRFEYDPSSSEWDFLGTISNTYYVYPSSDKEVIYSNFDIERDGGGVFFSARPTYLMELEGMPGMLIRQAGGIISAVLMGFGIWLAVGLVPRLKSWFLRL